jgi:uncharacterized protein YneF (UPF0154 family)
MDTSLVIGISIGVPLALIAGLLLGYFLALKAFKSKMKKNPPINEQQIRMMYAQMGRKPSEAQVKQIMNSMKNQGK